MKAGIEAARVNSEIRSGSSWEEIYGEEQAEEKRRQMSNRFEGEGNPFYNKTHTEENKRKFAMNAKEQHTGKTRSEETRKKISEAHKGRVISEETREKISETMSEVWENCSEEEKQEYCEKLSEAQKKRWERKGKKLSKEQVRTALEASSSVAAAKRFACSKYEEVSRPTFDKYIKEYGLTDLKEQVKA